MGFRIELNASDYKEGSFIKQIGKKSEHKNMKLSILEKSILLKAEGTMITEFKIEAGFVDKLGLGNEEHLYLVKTKKNNFLGFEKLDLFYSL